MNRDSWLAAVGVVVLVAISVYVTAERRNQLPATGGASAVDVSTVIPSPFVMFRTLAPKDAHGRVSMVTPATRADTRYVSPLSCARVHYAGGTGVCLIEESAGTHVLHAAYLFNRSFVRGNRIELSGVPTRARVSPDGRRASITVYGEEHLPNGEERLATDSIIIDVASGTVVAKLHEFKVDYPGHPPLEGPLDFAGIAFQQDSDRFFATLLTATDRYIIAGSLSERRVTVVGTGLASEALSQDGKRLIVKKRLGERGHWQVLVLELATMKELPLNQGARSIDDQVEWLDDGHVLYHDATDQGTGLWALATDGVTAPRLIIADAYSPSVQQ